MAPSGQNLPVPGLPEPDLFSRRVHDDRVEPAPHDDVTSKSDQVAWSDAVRPGRREERRVSDLDRRGAGDDGAGVFTGAQDERASESMLTGH